MNKKQKILIIGASGFMGKVLSNLLQKNHEVIGTSFHGAEGYYQCDIKDKASVEALISTHKPEVVIHLAALTDVDLCERDKELAFNTHVIGTQNLVESCKPFNTKFIYFSTDFVFDGKKGSYNETDPTNPINNYGKTKFDGEKFVEKMDKHLIIRTSTPYSINHSSKKFLSILLEKLAKGEKVKAFDDFIRSPTLIENLAENIGHLLEKDYFGVLHLTSSSKISMYEAAIQVAEVFDFDSSLIEKSNSNSVVLDAPRPLDTSFDVSLAKKLGLNVITFKEGLLQVKK